MKSYKELITLKTFEERYRYLRINGEVGKETFGYDRYLNQLFYRSPEWKKFRREIIIRDNGCDLGILGREIHDNIFIHHINPINPDDILNRNLEILLNADNSICVSKATHDAIHFGDESKLFLGITERKRNDTCPWRDSNE